MSIQSHQLGVVIGQGIGAVGSDGMKIGSQPIKHGHEVIADALHTCLAEIADGFRIVGDVAVTGGASQLNILMDGNALDDFHLKTVRVDLDGKICEWGDIDMWRCYAFYTHAGRYYNPFVPKEVFDANENGNLDLLEGKTNIANEQEIMKVYGALQKYFPSWVGYNMAKCGGCIRGCVSMLEKKGGCMEGRFKEPLRKGKPWKLDR